MQVPATHRVARDKHAELFRSEAVTEDIVLRARLSAHRGAVPVQVINREDALLPDIRHALHQEVVLVAHVVVHHAEALSVVAQASAAVVAADSEALVADAAVTGIQERALISIAL